MEENNVVKMNAEETKDLDFTKEAVTNFMKRIVMAAKEVSDSHSTKEEGGRRFRTVIIDFLRENGVDDVSEADFDDPDGIVVLEECMDFLVRLHQRMSHKALAEIEQILEKLDEES